MARSFSLGTILNLRRIVLCLLLVVSLLTVRWSGKVLETANNWGVPVGHALRVELLGRLVNTNPIPAIVHGSPQNNERVRITNTGSHRIMFDESAPTALWYSIEVEEGGRWKYPSYQLHGRRGGGISHLTYVWSTSPSRPLYARGMAGLELKPGESLEFPVRVPLGSNRWRVRVAYYEMPTQNKLTGIIDRAFALFGRGFNRQPGKFTAKSEPHAPPRETTKGR